MSVSTHRCFASCFAVVYTLAMVCLVESRPPSEAMRVGLAHEAITDWINSKKGEAFVPIGNQTCNEHHATGPRILNHPRRASNERDGGMFTDNGRPDSGKVHHGSKPRKEDSPIVFPGMIPKKPEVEEKFRPEFEPDPKIFKACASGESYCTDVNDYPAQRIMDVLSNNVDKFQAFFGSDRVTETNLVHRIDDPSETPLCVSTETTVFPKVAQNEKNKPLFIVNHPSVPESLQGVRVEKCHTKTGTCAFAENFPNGYRATCKQKYIYRRLLALNEQGDPYPDSFLFPSCCVCSVRIDPTIASRMGFPLKPDTTPIQRNNLPTNTKNSDAPKPVASEVTTAHSEKIDVAAKNTTQKPASSQKTSSKIVFMDNPSVPLPLAEGEAEEETAV